MRLSPALFVLLLGCRAKSPADDTGTVGDTHLSTDADGDGYLADEDCDDSSALVNPGASEICDGIDNNCDGAVDEDVTTTFYADADGDGFGDPGASTESCEAPDGYVSIPNDCDDSSDDSYPGAPERCDGLDNDCDDTVDEDVRTEWYADADDDGYGDPDSAYAVCDPPPGYVSNDDDCDDTNDSAFPGGIEVCDEADNDCDGATDEDVTTTFYQDTDSDNYGVADVTTESCDRPTGYAALAGDCDDTDDDISPNGVELCDGVDNDCDGTVDEDASADAPLWYTDTDGDGYGGSGTTRACALPSGYADNNDDCDDSDGGISPDAAEVCDGEDNDCDGTVDEDDATDAARWYADSDSDGYGSAVSTVACDAPSGFSASSGDCDDGSDDIYPGAAEVCDGEDNDCDGAIDEGVTSTFYLDRDGDGYGADSSAVTACSAPTAVYVAAGGDCDDSDDTYSPGAAEGCDGEDYNCDGAVDGDDDGDGYAADTCGGDDCDDSDSSILPEDSGLCALGSDCLDILDGGRSSGDGDYTIDPDGYATGGEPFVVTCDMTTDGGGWTQVVSEDYVVDTCPSPWVAQTTYGACYRGTVTSGTAASVSQDTYGIPYAEVMGSAAGRQYASLDAFHGTGDVTSTTSIEGIYLDGISITHGAAGARSHIFSYAAGLTSGASAVHDCPSVGGLSPSSVVGSDYLCQTGNTSTTTWTYTLYSTSLFAGTVWQVALSSTTTDDIEVRLMADQPTADEELYLTALELWIR